MKKTAMMLIVSLLIACSGNDSKKETYTKILRERIGNELPFNSVKIADVENGTAVIVDGSWCYWIDHSGKIFCVNGTSKSLMHNEVTGKLECEDAPIKVMFSDIVKLAK